MPLYEYACESCGKRFERIRKFSDLPLEICPLCGGGPVHKLVSSPAIQFKGSGFYITDYGRKGESSGGEGKSTKSTESRKDPTTSADSKEKDTKKTSDSTESSKTPSTPPSTTPKTEK